MATLADLFLEDKVWHCMPVILNQCSSATLLQLYKFAAGCEYILRRHKPLQITFPYQHVKRRPTRQVKRKYTPIHTTTLPLDQWHQFLELLTKALQHVLVHNDLGVYTTERFWVQTPTVGLTLLQQHFSQDFREYIHLIEVAYDWNRMFFYKLSQLPNYNFKIILGMRLWRKGKYVFVRGIEQPDRAFGLTGNAHIILDHIVTPNTIYISVATHVVVHRVQATNIDIYNPCDAMKVIAFLGCNAMTTYATRTSIHTIIIDHCHQTSHKELLDSIYHGLSGRLIILRNIPETFVLPMCNGQFAGFIAIIGCPSYLVPENTLGRGYGSAALNRLPKVPIFTHGRAVKPNINPKHYAFYRIKFYDLKGWCYRRAKLSDLTWEERAYL